MLTFAPELVKEIELIYDNINIINSTMNKKIYQMPCVKVVNIKISRNLLAGSPVGSVQGSAGLGYGGASSSATNPDDINARGRGGDIWDDDDEY